VNLSFSIVGIQVGDEVVIDGGMATFEVVEKLGKDLKCKCTDPGLLLPRAKLSFWRDGKLVGSNYELPTLSVKVDSSFSSFKVLDDHRVNRVNYLMLTKLTSSAFI
jgi:hypothetical protein